LKEEWGPNNETNSEAYYQDWKELPKDVKKRRGKLEFNMLPKPFQLKGVKILYPFYASPRMNAQQSFFTIQDSPWEPLENYRARWESERGRSPKDRHIQIKRVRSLSHKPVEMVTQCSRISQTMGAGGF
jgi:hypothetical protein